MMSLDKVKLCKEYIRYGARSTIAQVASGVTRKQAKRLYESMQNEPSASGRLPTRWSAFLRRCTNMQAPSQKFLGLYHAQCGDRIFAHLANWGVVEAYKAYLSIYAQDPVLIDLSLAWTLARAISQQEEGCEIKNCHHCGQLYVVKSHENPICWLCIEAKEKSGFLLPVRSSGRAAAKLRNMA